MDHGQDARASARDVLDWPGKNEMMAHLGIRLGLLPIIGVLEISLTVLYPIPRTAFLGAVLLTGYLGGALLTHLRIGDPWFFPLIFGALAWAGLAMRQPIVFQLVLGMYRETTHDHGGQP